MLATVDVYYCKFSDLQVDFFDDAQFAFVTSNAGGSEIYGAELQVDWATPVEGLALSGSFGRLESKFTEFCSSAMAGRRRPRGVSRCSPGRRRRICGRIWPGIRGPGRRGGGGIWWRAMSGLCGANSNSSRHW